jgi:hypothetical protein
MPMKAMASVVDNAVMVTPRTVRTATSLQNGEPTE